MIWSNPPIRIGKAALHELLERWLDRLTPDGRAVLVVQKHLGADSLHRWLAEQGWPTTRLASAKGYRSSVLRVDVQPAALWRVDLDPDAARPWVGGAATSAAAEAASQCRRGRSTCRPRRRPSRPATSRSAAATTRRCRRR